MRGSGLGQFEGRGPSVNKARILILGLVVFWSCSSVGDIKVDEVERRTVCMIGSFTVLPTEHKTVQLEQPFLVRTVKGKFTNTLGEWPENPPRPALFEIRRMGETAVIQTLVDSEGNFKIPSVPEGQYCFKATAYLWESVMGIIIVSKRASRKNSIHFVMERDS
jgi:hypothetical protein